MPPATSTDPTHRAIQAVWHLEAPILIARLTRMVRDVGLAEELAQDALVAALESWPSAGVPDKPGAWLMTAAKRRALNLIEHHTMRDRKHQEIRVMSREEIDAPLDDDVGDDLLRLVFISCHPVLPREGRVALTLRLLGGLTTDEIARAFLVPEATIAQRIVRAKRTLAEEKVPFEMPRGDERAARLASVLEVIYLVFNEGFAATAGDDLMRPALCEEAMRLARVLAGLMPDESEAHGLVALCELHASRMGARVDADGEPVLLLDQDRSRWDHLLIRHGLAALERAESLAAAGTRGSYTLQAGISACHARALDPAATDWARIAAIYADLHAVTPSPIVELNRAVAVGMAHGPAAGLAILDALAREPALRDYYLLPGARAEMLERLGRLDEARAEFERAASLTRNTRERDVLLRRAHAACKQ
jgi:RNA polymerase sigma factor (sigma-70 family)